MKPLWRCPKCGHRFASRNLWHSCGRFRLADHFKGKDPALRRLFGRYVALLRRNGPVTVYAQKTRIVCMVRVRFAGAVVRKRWLEAGLWLKRRATHPTLRKVEFLPPGDHLHYFRLRRPEDLDPAFAALTREAYRIGVQAHRRSAR
jgi:hypothetical protein